MSGFLQSSFTNKIVISGPRAGPVNLSVPMRLLAQDLIERVTTDNKEHVAEILDLVYRERFNAHIYQGAICDLRDYLFKIKELREVARLAGEGKYDTDLEREDHYPDVVFLPWLRQQHLPSGGRPGFD